MSILGDDCLPPSYRAPFPFRLGRVALVCCSTLAAQQSLASPLPAEAAQIQIARGAPQTRATRREGHLRIDGRIDEPAWQLGPRETGFWQREPHDGEPSEFPTEFWTLYDPHNLYVAIRAHDPEPEQIRALLTRRDQESSSDWLAVSIDTFHDRRTAFTFAINPKGVLRDYLLYDDVVEDTSWNAVWEGAAAIDEQGWTAELRIPFSQLRFTADQQHLWGFQVGREVQRAAEQSFWSPWPQGSAGRVSLYGEISGLRDIGTGFGVEIVPYALGGGRLEAGENRWLTGLGGDLKYHIAKGILLSAAINPDFGQVEADPSNANLSDVETFFPEQRPFFVEGVDLFRLRLSQGNGDNAVEELFYSRRIGATPGAELDVDVVGEQPQTTTILGAAKLVGRAAGGWTYGGFNAVTAEEKARVRDDAGTIRRQIIEPLASYSVLALRKDLDQGRTKIGGVLTGVHRRLEGTDVGVFHEQAYSGGVQLSHKLGNDDWLVEAKVLGSSVHGDAVTIDNTQTDSPHYFQRSDATHIDYDPARRSMHGFSGQYRLGRVGGDHWLGAIGGDTRSPGFEVNDLGFQTRSDYLTQWLWLQYRDDQANAWTRHWRVNLNAWGSMTYGREPLSWGGDINFGLRTLETWEGGGGVWRSVNPWNVRLLRGGPRVRGVSHWGGWSFIQSDQRQPIRAKAEGFGELYDDGDMSVAGASAELKIQAGSHVELSIAPSWQRTVNDIQYIDTVDDAGTARNLVGRVTQITLGVTMRLDITFTPNLSLQAYVQPFVSNGKYKRFREVVSPRARSYADRFATVDAMVDDDNIAVDRDGDGANDYWVENPDFGLRELRSNLVLRWEYLPGSTLFVVWSHGRTSEDDSGRFALSRNLRRLGQEAGEHVVLVKMAYLFEV